MRPDCVVVAPPALDLTGLTAFLYQRDREIIAFARPDPVVAGTRPSSVAQVVDIRSMSAV